ncbi:MAG: hypothetical protein IK152_09375 [Lachnospiraceae bacterium]|nr:hypothetical protein [Lachnospiraceae bacterium]MBR5338181.1 hypothetical protein [Lachnospiraceae bacterium]
MDHLITCISFINLGVNTYYDMRHRKISLVCCGCCGLAALLLRVTMGGLSPVDVLLALIPGAFLALTVIISSGKVGMGDALVFLSMGLAEPVTAVVTVMLLGMCMSGLFSLGALACGKVGLKSRIPMMPFVVTAYVVVYVIRRMNG